ncbi:MAG: hypothetical protein OEW67_09370 [Cyclobacteriaceae bacterium]|nr:hypothetical protein [Cyclobacteriaceae bacterium]
MDKAEKSKENVKITHNVERVSLYDFGYERSGSVKGDSDVYASYLDRIINGDLVDEKYSGFTDEERNERVKEIKELEKEQKEKEKENTKVEVEIKAKEAEIEKHRNELLKVRKSRAKDNEKLKTETFSPFKFTLNLFILIMLSVYLFFFYISATYKALYVDFEGIAEKIAEGIGTGSVMPAPQELSEAIQFNFMLFLVPFVFYAFGWAFHVLLELKNKFKFLFLGLLILITFIVDFLLALIIHNNTESAKELMGLATEHWSSSATFYIILFLGFMVYIIWSILFDSMLREWDKKHITNNIKKILKHLQGDIKKLNTKLVDISEIKNKISDYRDDVSIIMNGNLKRYIDQFSSGWISYLSPANMKDVKENCINVKRKFEEKHNIKSGKVQVVSRISFK